MGDMMRVVDVRGRLLPVVLVLAAGCGEPRVSETTFYGERIDPILQNGCVRQNTGCHVADERGSAVGNLDLSSFDALMRRKDVLAAYGPYPSGVLLLKAGEPVTVEVETWDPDNPTVTVQTDIRHNAGQTIELGSRGFAQLKQWIEAGHTRNGVSPEALAESEGNCLRGVGEAVGFDPDVAPLDATMFSRFVDQVQPILKQSCAGSRCHGSRIADLYLTCGDNQDERRWNYFVSTSHLTSPVSTSGLLRRPLSTFRGGTFHEGGNVFDSTEDTRYQVIRAWAEDLIRRSPETIAPPPADEGLAFFANRVQPAFVRKGCMFLNCHSPSMFHDLRLRGGSQGHFSRIATERNYEISKLLLALESPDPNQSRLVAKNLFPAVEVDGAQGIVHRGGALFEDFSAGSDVINPASLDDCSAYDADTGDINDVPAYCIVARWHEIERQALLDSGELSPDVVSQLVWVSRPLGVGATTAIDAYRPGADLLVADVTLDGQGRATLGASASLLAGCGLVTGTADVRTPAVSWDATKIAFAARSAAAESLRLYWMDADGGNCEQIPDVAPSSVEQDGIALHDFDPAFAPDGRIVFASTRGNLDVQLTGRGGPTRTPAAMEPNANLYVYEPSQAAKVRQLTFLLNQELQPSFMADGRVIFTSEKREPDFHQLAGRRQNLDGGDYHPLFAQRGSVGFAAATEIVELPNRNLAMIGGPIDAADGAGAVVVVNRSIGPDEVARDPDDRFYISSRTYARSGAFAGGSGAFRSPAVLPTGRLILSCDVDATDLTSGNYDFDLCELDPNLAAQGASGALVPIGGQAGRADVEAVAVYPRSVREIFESRIDEANANTRIEIGAKDAEVHVLDFFVLASLLFENTRGERPINYDIAGFEVLESLPPPVGATSFADVLDSVVDDAYGTMYLNRQSLGGAPLFEDGSTKIQIPGGTPILLRVTDSSGASLVFPEDGPFQGEMIQREQMQFYPGERANQSFPSHLFNAMCGGCHGSLTGRELDVAVDIDVLTGASLTQARSESAISLSSR